jgi:hypothetical protein
VQRHEDGGLCLASGGVHRRGLLDREEEVAELVGHG